MVRLGETSEAAGGADCAIADDCFKPKCRDIPSSIREHPNNADGRFGGQAEDALCRAMLARDLR